MHVCMHLCSCRALQSYVGLQPGIPSPHWAACSWPRSWIIISLSDGFNVFQPIFRKIWVNLEHPPKLNKVNNLTKQLGFETTNQSASDDPLGYTQSCIIWGHYSWIISWQTVCPIYTVLLIKKILGSGVLENYKVFESQPYWIQIKHASSKDNFGKLVNMQISLANWGPTNIKP